MQATPFQPVQIDERLMRTVEQELTREGHERVERRKLIGKAIDSNKDVIDTNKDAIATNKDAIAMLKNMDNDGYGRNLLNFANSAVASRSRRSLAPRSPHADGAAHPDQ